MIKVYGSSDDLIEVEGDIEEEFTLSEYDENLLAFSNGVVLRIKYNDSGIWRISPVTGNMVIHMAPEDDEDNYSDVAIIEDDIRWVVQGIAGNFKPKP
jgi:hypothetical protein